MKKHVNILIALLFVGLQVFGQTYKFQTEKLVYKKVGGQELEMTLYRPQVANGRKLPAIIFFFGGGWVSGTTEHFKLQSEYFASRGMVAICADYRVKSRQGTTPFESVKDARSAMRYLKTHGDELGIDVDKIVASGGSAGGHLAACTAIIQKVNEESDDLSVSTVPMALILFNPVVDTGKRGYGQEKLEGREFELSPVHNITAGVPPTLILHGKNDTTVPYENVVRFKCIMKQEGNSCKLIGYKKQTHGFFNYSRSPKYFQKTMNQSEKFLESMQLLKGESWIKKYCKDLR